MANYNKKKSFGRIIAGILCGVLTVAAVAGAGTALYMGAKNNGWFDSEEEIEEPIVESSVDNLQINEGASTAKLSISASKTSGSLTSSSVNYVGSTSYTLTAVYNDDATYPQFTWSSSDTTNITVTPSDDTLSCTVKLKSAFSTQITITCTSVEDSSITVTCTVDYIRRVNGCSLYLKDDYQSDWFYWGSKGSTATVSIPNDCWDSTYSDTNSAYLDNLIYYYYFSQSTGTGTINETYSPYSLKVSYLSESWEIGSTGGISYGEFLGTKALNLGISTDIYDLSWITNSSYRYTVYNSLLEDYNNGTGATFTLQIKGDVTGGYYEFTYTLLLDPSELYTAVSSVSLNQSSIVF